MSITELFSIMRDCSSSKKNLPIKIESEGSLQEALNLLINSTNKKIQALILFKNGQHQLYDALCTPIVQSRLKEFLAETGTEIELITNEKKKIQNIDVFSNLPKNKLKIVNISENLESKLRKVNEIMFDFFLGDDVSVIIGFFNFEELSYPTYVNFNDRKNCKVLVSNIKSINDCVLNQGVRKNDYR